MTTAGNAQPEAKEDTKAPAKSSAKGGEPELKDIQYTGEASLRTITKEDWLTLGIEHDDLEWNFHNNFRIPAEDISDGARSYLLKKDGRFKLVAAEEDSEE